MLREMRDLAVVNLSSDDDAEANEDLSLKILEKALSRRAKYPDPSVFDDSLEASMVNLCGLRECEGEKEGEKMEELKSDNHSKAADVEESGDLVEQNPGASNNIVLRKLLRGPRYFDPPDSNWETCFNCGEEGHMAVNCPSATRRKKPCFVCCSLDHNVKQCPKALDCFICKKGGHRAKDCPDKFKSGSKISSICLRCGDTGHDMFSCKNDYAEDDLKDIQCYICRRFGHLCCVDFVDSSPRLASCYRCGQSGHSGLECGKKTGEAAGKVLPSSCYRCGEGGHFARDCLNSSRASSKQCDDSLSSCYKCGEEGHFARECTNSFRVHLKQSNGSLSSCYKCGEDGHFARECTSSHGVSLKECYDLFSACHKCGEEGHFARNCVSLSQVPKRYRESSTQRHKSQKKYRGQSGLASIPREVDKSKRKKTLKGEKGLKKVRKSKQSFGWITDDPGEFSDGNNCRSRKRYSSSKRRERHQISYVTSGGRLSSPPSYHRHSVSRFGGHPREQFRPNYDRW